MPIIDKAENLLREHELRLTRCRKDILKLFIKKPFALSQSILEDRLNSKYDRVTIYRTLKSFIDAGFIHKVLDDKGIIKYALCPAECTSVHHHNHIHFKCIKCGRTTCIEEVAIPRVAIPGQYDVKEVSMLVTGICELCNR